jgi:hypothetical protein
MAKSKFTLALAPTFKATVLIPIPGGKPEPIEFIFKGRTRDEFKEFVDGIQANDGKSTDADTVMDIASGWDLSDAFDRENIEMLTTNYLGAARAIIEKYFSELTQARLGN